LLGDIFFELSHALKNPRPCPALPSTRGLETRSVQVVSPCSSRDDPTLAAWFARRQVPPSIRFRERVPENLMLHASVAKQANHAPQHGIPSTKAVLGGPRPETVPWGVRSRRRCSKELGCQLCNSVSQYKVSAVRSNG
jgi:hypothetical protein